MTSRFFLPTIVFVSLMLPARGAAQVPPAAQVPAPDGAVPGCPGCPTVGAYSYGKERKYGTYGAYPPPYWNYPGLAGGPYITTAYPFAGWPGYRGAFGSFWTNGLSLYGPPVPVYGPIPGVFGNYDLVNQWHQKPTFGLGLGYFGWIGPFRASPRPYPPTVNAWPIIESVPGPAGVGTPVADAPGSPAPGLPTPAAAGACLHLSVKVPQPAAEVFVDGVKTSLTGTDRLFESPPLEDGKEYAYELTARWVEGGARVERKKVVVGRAGEVVRVDLTAP